MNFKDTNYQSKNPKTSQAATASLVFSILGLILILAMGLCWFEIEGMPPLIFVIFLLWYPSLFLFSLALIFGIIAVMIIKVKKGMRGLNRAIVSICLISLGFFALYMFFVKSIPIAHIERCRNNLRNLFTSVNAYSHDNNGKYPHCATWCDDVSGKYGTKPEWFRCPGDKRGPCSYAMNSNVENWSIRTPGKRVLLFESKPGWNQFGGPELVSTKNHKGKGCCVCYVNGGMEFIPVDKLGNLRWTDEKVRRKKPILNKAGD